MLVSHRYRFIFIHVYKVAGTSMREALERFCEDRWKRRAARLLGRTGLYRPDLPPPHLKAREARDMLPPEVFDGYYKFAFVRNPWDWQVSLYHFMRSTPDNHQHELAKGFSGFSEYLAWRVREDRQLQKAFVTDEAGNLIVDRVGRLETVEADLEAIRQAIGLPPVRLPHVNRSRHRDYRTYYTDETRRMVAEAFKEDIELFGYTFDGVAEPAPVIAARGG